MLRTALIGTIAVACLAGVRSAGAGESPVNYPETRRVDHVDVYHGVEVPDSYRWLEADVRESPEVADWVKKQNEVTFKYLESIPEREPIRKRLTALWDYEKYGSPFKAGGRYYFYKNDGLQNQSVLYVQPTLDAEPHVLIDPNTWSEDGTISLEGTAFSEVGKYVAYGIAEAGSDWRTWRVMEIESRHVLPDELKWIKFGGVAWTEDGRGFFYSRYKEPQEGEEYQSLNLNQKLYYHRVGTPQSDDVLVYRTPEHPEWGFSPEVTEDGVYLVITVWKGTDDKYRVLYRDLTEPYGMPVHLVGEFDHEYTFIGNDGPLFYFKTDVEAPRRRVIAIDIRNPSPPPSLPVSRGVEPPGSSGVRQHWHEIIPQTENTLTAVNIVNNMFIAQYLKDAVTQVTVHALDGTLIREVEFPGIGSASGFGGRRAHTETFYSFSSFATPPSIYRYDMITGQSTLLRQADVDFHPDDYEAQQVFYHSKDGTRIPMFLAYKKGLKRDGHNPTLLYGYGGFNIPLTPRFSISRLAWMEMGGVFAMPNLRGGGEYGEEWHQAGAKLNKQNVFDDFIAAAEWLIDNNYTRPQKLAIQGGSNGGLLVGAVMTQRPELFGACLPAVGVMDMLRFHKFTAGRFWVDDYGSAEDPAQFKVLRAYSPYHNLKEGTHYPATLITTADTDDRVVPAHSFKFAARLQQAQAGPKPCLIRIETRAGHGAGKPTSKLIDEITDQWAFLVHELEMNLDVIGKE